ECFNPTSSAKDRAALYMIEDAERKGLLKEGYTIIEPTSGNTGIGLCAIAAAKGYKCIIVMPDNMSIERQRIMKGFGAEVVLTPASEGMSGAIRKADELLEENEKGFIPQQFSNPANALAHYETTANEIYHDLEGNIDIFVAGVGTGGTITGVGKGLKEKLPNVKIYGVEPLSSPFLTQGKAGTHKIQGIGAGFVPDVYDDKYCDEIICVSDEDAINYAKQMALCEGILVGISSGAALCAAKSLAQKEENKGKNIVVLLPDTGERYISTELFD
ncbi:MAG: cysteine synthase A, partial [Clostridia bacterium]|nr:cysteine synthase A [Clostridia bacterium]